MQTGFHFYPGKIWPLINAVKREHKCLQWSTYFVLGDEKTVAIILLGLAMMKMARIAKQGKVEVVGGWVGGWGTS